MIWMHPSGVCFRQIFERASNFWSIPPHPGVELAMHTSSAELDEGAAEIARAAAATRATIHLFARPLRFDAIR